MTCIICGHHRFSFGRAWRGSRFYPDHRHRLQDICGGHEYDLGKAQSLLDEAGVKAGDLNIHFVVENSSTTNNIAEFVETYLGAMSITSADLSTAVLLFMAGETELVISSVGASAQDSDQKYDTVKASFINATVRIMDPEMDGYLYLMIERNSVDTAVCQENYEAASQ